MINTQFNNIQCPTKKPFQVHNFNINEIAQSLPSEDSVVPVMISLTTKLQQIKFFKKVVSRVLGEMIDTFGWSSVLLVYFNDGVTRWLRSYSDI